MKYSFIVLCLFVLLTGSGSDSTGAQKSQEKRPERTVKIHSADEIFSLFTNLHYTREQWQQGNLSIPRIYICGIPAHWQDAAHKLTVDKKKKIFFRLLAPLILHANEVIKADRATLLALAADFSSLAPEEQQWLLSLARKYKLSKAEDTTFSRQQRVELSQLVDTIPVSLTLAQAAEESGWGTSRFAILGNSLFGQWDFSGKGIKPKKQRKELGNYGLARFDTPLDSVVAYMLNINTHHSYSGLRDYRAQLRSSGAQITGHELATKLDKYSERGQDYVKELQQIMRINHLATTDEAFLLDNEIIYLTFKE